ncbi:MAG: GDYXXLXY domain-containing protein [Bauldia sp.]
MRLAGFGRIGMLLAFIVQAGLLGWIIGDRAMLLKNGREIRLPVIPVDPHDLLRGDYVILSYPMSRLQTNQIEGDDAFSEGEPIFVTLAPEGDSWKAVAMHRERPAGDDVVLKGVVSGVTTLGDNCGAAEACATYAVDYNLEQFFVPEGAGRDLETLRNDQKLSVDVALAPSGRAALKRLLVDGNVRYEEMMF